MPADFPAFAMGGSSAESPVVHFHENTPISLKLNDGRQVHILIENPATKKPAPVLLTAEQKRTRTFIEICLFFLILTICMICTLLDSV